MASRQQFANSVSWNTLTVVLQVVIQLVYTGLLARLLTPDSFTLMGIVVSIMGFAELFAQMGVGPALIQRKDIHQQHVNGAFYTAVILGVFFTLLFVFTAPLFAKTYNIPLLEPIIQVVCSSFVISALAVVPRSMMLREMRFKVMFNASMISIIGGNVVVGLSLAWLGWNVWAYVWALFAQNALMTIALWWYQPVKVTRSWNWPYTRELIGYGLGSSLFNALNYIATKMDVMLVPYFSKGMVQWSQAEQLRLSGMYERSNYIMTQPITIMGKLSDSVLFSGMARLQDDTHRLRRTMMLAKHFISIVILPVTAFVAFFSAPLIRVWLGNQYDDAIPVLQVLFAAVVFRTWSKLGDSLLRAKGAVYKGSRFKAIYVLLIGLGIYLSIGKGMPYVAASIVLATAIHYLMSMMMVRQLIGLSWSDMFKSIIPGILLGVIAAGWSYVMRWLFEQWQLPNLLILLCGAIGLGLMYFTLLFAYPRIFGNRDLNPLAFLPERFKQYSVIKRLLDKI